MKKIIVFFAMFAFVGCSSMTHDKAVSESSAKPVWYKDALYHKGEIVAQITQDEIGMFEKAAFNEKMSQTPYWINPILDRFPASVSNAPASNKITAKTLLGYLPQKSGPETYVDEMYTIKGVKSGTELKLLKLRVPSSIDEKNNVVYSRYITIFNEKTKEVQKVEYCKNCSSITMDSFAMEGKWEKAIEPFLAKL